MSKEQFKYSELTFQLIVESAPNAMVLVNNSGFISLVNKETEKLFGYNRLELIGSKLEILIPDRFKEEHPTQRSSFFKSPQTRSMGAGRDLFALKKDGTEVQVEIGLNPIDTPDGLMVLASIIDITERKLQELTQKRQVELEAKNKELEQFAYIASHDLQEPLRTVSNYLQIFEEDYSHVLDAEAKNYLVSMNNATRRMSVLVKALLEFSRLGRGKELTSVDINQIIREVLSDLETLIKSSGAIITVSEMPTLNAYETEVRQLFQNLLSNAIKFRKPNVIPEIHISSQTLNERWEFSISDNGIGIDSIHFERIFYIFQRLHASEEYEGNGIGLANCKKIVDLHKGEIKLDSVLGKGTTFYFTL